MAHDTFIYYFGLYSSSPFYDNYKAVFNDFFFVIIYVSYDERLSWVSYWSVMCYRESLVYDFLVLICENCGKKRSM